MPGEVSWSSILDALIPIDSNMAAQLSALRASFDPVTLDEAIEGEITKIDGIVGTALGLSQTEIEEIRRDMTDDPFLSQVRPRYPHFRPRQHGCRVNLERVNRYRAAE